MYNPFSLKGKNILITGASSGIGRGICIDTSKMGATVHLHKKKLKDEFLGKSADEIIELRKNGVEVTREVYEPQLSFMGDCLGESLLENPDVFKSKVLITECTFLDKDEEQMAHKKGHTHLNSIVKAKLDVLRDDILSKLQGVEEGLKQDLDSAIELL